MNGLDTSLAGMSEQTLERSEGMLEIALLLSIGQLARLEEAAGQRRLTTAALVRRLIQDFLTATGPPPRAAVRKP